MRAFRKGLTAGLRESVDWAASAGGGSGSQNALGGFFAAGDDALALGPSGTGAASVPAWEPESGDTAADHCLVQVLSATGLGWLATSATSVCVALCLADPRGGSKGRRGVTLPHDKAASPVWNRWERHNTLLSLPCPPPRVTHPAPLSPPFPAPPSIRDLGVASSSGDWLVLELYEDAACATGCLATAHVAVDLLPEGGQPVSLPLRRCGDPRSCAGGASGTVTVARLAWEASVHTSKTLFFVRHGQSRWNDAQKSRRFDAMMAFDHPLTRAGADQALALREKWRAAAAATQERRGAQAARGGATPGAGSAPLPAVPHATALEDAFAEFCSPTTSPSDQPPAPAGAPAALPGDTALGGLGGEEEDEWVEAFLSASLLASSPLTRAVQTAMLALHGHPMLGGGSRDGQPGGESPPSCRLTLLRAAREIKRGVGSLDSVGKCVGGPDLVARCSRMLREELPPGLFEQLIQAACDEALVDVNDTAGVEWWTAADDVDTDADVGLRVSDLLASLQFAQGSSAVLVGHSLLFRDLVRRLTLTSSTSFGSVPPGAASLCAQLCEAKLSNAGCCALKLAWGRGGAVRITDARLLFGSTLASD